MPNNSRLRRNGDNRNLLNNNEDACSIAEDCTSNLRGLMDTTLDSFQELITDQIANLVEDLATSTEMNEELKYDFLSKLYSQVGKHLERLNTKLPEIAPELWQDREDRREKPQEFIKRVYRVHLGKGLTQAHIRRLDIKLYRSFHYWQRTNNLPVDLVLPTQKEYNDQLLGDKKSEPTFGQIFDDAPHDVKEHYRLYSISATRKRRIQKKNS